MEALSNRWTRGYVAPFMGAMNTTERAWLRREHVLGRRAALPAIVFGAASVPLAVVQAWIIAATLGAALLGHATPALFIPCVVFFLCALARSALSVLADRASTAASSHGRRRLRREIVQRLLDAGPSRLRGHHSGELVALAVDQVEALDGLFARWIPAAVLAFVAPFLVLMAAFAADPFSGCVLFLGGLLVPVGMAVAGIGAAQASQRQFTAMARLQTRFVDRVHGIATIVLAGRIEDETRMLALAAADLRRRTMRVLRVAFLSSAVLDCAIAAAFVIVSLHDAHILREPGDAGHPARLLFALLLVPEFFGPLRAFAVSYADGMQARTVAQTVAALPTAQAAPPIAETARIIQAHGIEIAFDDVSLTWDPARGPALTSVSFRVAAGETLIVAGPSGSGKSSLIELLLGFARPDSGNITLNGMRIETIVPYALAGVTAWIGQRPLLLAGTLRENIRYGRYDATDTEVMEAAMRARLGPVVEALPQGLDTPLGEGGYGLSGGQVQRVAIARAFLRNAPLLLLDEPTAHLDPITEAEVLESLKRLVIGRTVILATHSTAAQAIPGRRIDLRHGRLLGTAARGAA